MKKTNENSIDIQRNPSVYWFACVDFAVLDDERLSPIEKVVFCMLCRYTNWHDRKCYPSIKTIAQKAKCSEYSVQKALKRLIELGLIERQERFVNGRQTTSLYKIIGFEAPCYKDEQESKGGSTTLTPPPTTLTDGGQSDVPPINYIQNNDIIYSTREAELPNSTDSEFPLVFQDGECVLQTPEPELEKKSKPVINADEVCTPDDAPEIMKTTAELLLLKTGRENLTWNEISALRALSATHYPSRVQKEIETACERFKRKGRSLSTLTFDYIAGSLQHQQTRLTAKTRKAKDKTHAEVVKKANEELKPKENQPCTDEEADEEMAKIEAMQAKLKAGYKY